MNNCVIARIKGGLGNQLFCYAAARRLAIKNDAELVIDHETGFVRDFEYNRKYALHRFNIPCRTATGPERLEPLERYRRAILKWRSSRKEFFDRNYIAQEGGEFEPRLLTLKVKGKLYLDGYWQSEDYFQDVEPVIRQDLQIHAPQDEVNQRLFQQIVSTPNAVSLHVRWFADPISDVAHNLASSYYHHAIDVMERKFRSPVYFVFSDQMDLARKKLALPEDRVFYISHNQGDEEAYADLWLMSNCQHFITANSTFSWWGAWLSNHASKVIVTPSIQHSGLSSWGFKGLIPDSWLQV
jgi:Glycosyl transferase family 11